jgi:hypothetical protein
MNNKITTTELPRHIFMSLYYRSYSNGSSTAFLNGSIIDNGHDYRVYVDPSELREYLMYCESNVYNDEFPPCYSHIDWSDNDSPYLVFSKPMATPTNSKSEAYTKSGRLVTDIKVYNVSGFCIAGLLDGRLETWMADGRFLENSQSNLDLIL